MVDIADKYDIEAMLASLEMQAEQIAALQAERDAAWFGIEQGYSIEPRALIEAEAKTNGFKFGLAQAIHTIWKREPKVADRDAQVRTAFLAGYTAGGDDEIEAFRGGDRDGPHAAFVAYLASLAPVGGTDK